MNEQQAAIQKRIERRIESYQKRYFTPSKATWRRWKNEAKRELDNKNQLPLPLLFEK